VDKKLFPYLEGEKLRLDAPFIGFGLPLDDVIPFSAYDGTKNLKAETESSLASFFASRTSSNKHNLKSPT
jgi:hypothetical protein